jgi:hypothetical protein
MSQASDVRKINTEESLVLTNEFEFTIATLPVTWIEWSRYKVPERRKRLPVTVPERGDLVHYAYLL